ncbi:TrkH family potassium uptake protein [Paracoccaceae bacterium GXU_MW_L88]
MPRPRLSGPLSLVALPPPAFLALLYLALICVGALLLMMPAFQVAPVAPWDAFFTAVSAVTVTGLVTVDPVSHFNTGGQMILAALIQLGGLGLMTFAVLVLSVLGLQIGIPQKIFLREDLNQTSLADLMALVWIILRVVLIAELFGAALLAPAFIEEQESVWRGAWFALFHSISAFNNAGFALYPDGLMRFVAAPSINIVIPALFISGGLGYAVVSDLWRVRGWNGLHVHSKMMLAGTAMLLIGPMLLFMMLEWHNPGSLGALYGTGEKILASWFQVASPRTAGFNTLDYGAVHDPTALMIMTLMLIGGGPTSTAGGIKVTTFIVLLVATFSFFRRHQALNVFRRSLAIEELFKVLALVTTTLLLVMGSLFMISVHHDGDFLDLAFEVCSAIGTVGLTRGATGELTVFGQSIIMVLMFLGRVGPLTLGFFLAARSAPRLRYASVKVPLG